MRTDNQNIPFSPGYTWSENNMGNTNYSTDPAQGGMNGMGNMSGMGSSLSQLLAGIFGNSNYKNPASAAMPFFNRMQNPAMSGLPFLQQIPGNISPLFQNFINAGNSGIGGLQNYMGAGQAATNNLQGQYNRLLNDPSSVMNQIGSSFQTSPGYDFQKQQMTNSANNAAAAGGYVGSPQAQQQMASTIGGLANQDYYNYLNHGMDLYGQGLQGEQGISQMGLNAANNLGQLGYGASNSLASHLANSLMMQGQMGMQGSEDMNQMLANMAQLQYAGQQNKNQTQGANMGNLFGGIGGLVGDISQLFM